MKSFSYDHIMCVVDIIKHGNILYIKFIIKYMLWYLILLLWMTFDQYNWRQNHFCLFDFNTNMNSILVCIWFRSFEFIGYFDIFSFTWNSLLINGDDDNFWTTSMRFKIVPRSLRWKSLLAIFMLIHCIYVLSIVM